MRSWVLKFYKGRVTSVLSNVLPSDKHSAFLQLINSNSGRIAGSTAYQIADPMSNFNPSDLNILVPIGCRVGLRRQLKLKFDCTENADGIEIGRKYLSNWSKGTSRLTSPTGHPITITESNDDSFIPLMVAGYSTAESVLMGSESFTLLYPTLVNEGVVLPMSGYGVGMPRNLDHILLSRFHQEKYFHL
ncbi:hypothetical protein F5880DRAFT_1612582 [Lentinula raphanica]|nr:hypothetical protein F5880DRAFT_1612582 [Lentinula raphanica]